jgi:hypothetical protein
LSARPSAQVDIANPPLDGQKRSRAAPAATGRRQRRLCGVESTYAGDKPETANNATVNDLAFRSDGMYGYEGFREQ